MNEDEWKQDISKLKNYKIIESKFNNPYLESFVRCATSSDTKESVDLCRFQLPPEYTIESGGDMRCSGKSEILHLLFPELHKHIKFSTEEGRGNIRSIINHFSEPSDDMLVIYVKRNPQEKLKCLLKYRSIFNKAITREPEYSDALPNDLKNEAYSEMEYMRNNLLPEVYKHRNYVIVENINKEEEPDITDTKICGIINKQLDYHIKRIKSDIESSLIMQKRGLNLSRSRDSAKISIEHVKKEIAYIKDYIDKCNQENKIRVLENIIKTKADMYK